MADLWGVLLGGLIGVSGTTLSQWLLSKDERENVKKQSRAEKFEALVDTLYDHEQWLDEFRSKAIFASSEELRVSPYIKAQTLALVHFPQLADDFAKFDYARTEYIAWMYAAAQNRMSGNKDYSDGFAGAYEKYGAVRNKLFDMLRDFGRRTFH